MVNRDNVKPELNPQLTDVDAIKVDSRIVEPTRQFLEAARKIAPEETLISGYRVWPSKQSSIMNVLRN